MKLGRLIVRLVIGALFVGHGTQKLFGWFGGAGPAGTAEGMQALGFEPPRRHAVLAGVSESTGGALLVLGLATPVAAGSLIGVMLTAVRTVHLKNGPWNANGGYEYNAVLVATLMALAELGPGGWSLDHLLHRERTGPQWAMFALALGAATSTITIAQSARARARQEAEREPTEHHVAEAA